MNKIALAATMALLCLLLAFPLPAAAAQTVKVLKVSDGDTLMVLSGGKKVRLRVLGIDTPETHPGQHAQSQAKRLGMSEARVISWGKKARHRVARLIGRGGKVSLESDSKQPRRDRYGRMLAHVRLADGRLLSAVLVREGLAEVYRRFNVTHKRELLRLEAQARAERAGIWSQARPRR